MRIFERQATGPLNFENSVQTPAVPTEETNTAASPEIQTADPLHIMAQGRSVLQTNLFAENDLPVRTVSVAEMEKVNAAFNADISRLFQNAGKHSRVHKLGTALSLLQMLDSQKLGSDENENLEAYDREARSILGMRRSQLQTQVAELMQHPEVQREFACCRAKALEKTFGRNAEQVPQEYANYILSDDFYQQLQALSPEAQNSRLKNELMRLTALDPELAQQTAVRYAASEMQRNPMGIFERLPRAEQLEALDKVLQLKAHELGPDAELGKILSQTPRRQAVVQLLQKQLMQPAFLAASSEERGALLKSALANQSGQAAVDARLLLADLESHGDLNQALSALLTGVVLAGTTDSFIPENNGVITWHARRAASITTNALGAVSSIPDIAKFINADLQISKAATAIYSASEAIQGLGAAGKFVKVCQWLGPIGDAVSLPFDITAAFYESENEDSVGLYSSIAASGAGIMGVTGGIATALGSTGVGIPLAVGAVVVGIGATAVNAIFGESSLTGQVRQDLRYLGILDAEAAEVKKQTTSTRSAYSLWSGSYTERYDLSHSTVRARMKDEPLMSKVQIINHYMDQDTSSSEENLIYTLLKDTPYENDQFLQLMDALDTATLASELENRQEVRQTMQWLLSAYQKAGRPPGESLNAMLRQLSYEHREESIRDFLSDVSDAQFQALDATVLREIALRLMDGNTDDAEESTIYKVLERSSDEQLAEIIMQGKAGLVSELKSELESWQFNRLRDKMRRSSNAGVRYYATRY